MADAFTPAQLESLRAIIREFVPNQPPPGPQGPAGPQGPVGPPSTDGLGGSPHWHPAALGYFYPNAPSDYNPGNVIEKNRKNYYQDVFAFTNRIRVTSDVRDETGKRLLKQNLDTCLRGEAETWWNSEMSSDRRYVLTTHPDGINKWIENLETRPTSDYTMVISYPASSMANYLINGPVRTKLFAKSAT